MTCTENPEFVDASTLAVQIEKEAIRTKIICQEIPQKKFHPKTPDKFVDKEENTAIAKKAIVEPKPKAAQLKSKALNVGTVTDH